MLRFDSIDINKTKNENTMKNQLNNQLNNLIFGLSGHVLLNKEMEFFEKSKPLAFILFKRNIKNKEQLLNLTDSLKKLSPEAKIFIDQEGGRVARIKPPIAQKEYPAGKYFADIYEKNPEQAKKEIKENYSQVMKELKTFNIDSPCAPVCDLLNEEGHGIIGDRSFGDNVPQVVDLALKAIEGIKEQGGIAFLKHIPGHGRASVDSHLELPIVKTELKTLEQTDFKVFKELAKEEDVWGMTAHIIYECLDKEKPATLSKEVIKYIREEIGFKGILVTDDIGMKALHQNVKEEDKFSHFGKIAKECLEAGCDVVLHCSGILQEMEAVYEGLFG